MTGGELIRLIQSLQVESCPVFSVAQGYLSLVRDENISVIGNSLFLGHVEFDKRNLQAYFEEFYELVSETEAEAIFNDGKEVFLLYEDLSVKSSKEFSSWEILCFENPILYGCERRVIDAVKK